MHRTRSTKKVKMSKSLSVGLSNDIPRWCSVFLTPLQEQFYILFSRHRTLPGSVNCVDYSNCTVIGKLTASLLMRYLYQRVNGWPWKVSISIYLMIVNVFLWTQFILPKKWFQCFKQLQKPSAPKNIIKHSFWKANLISGVWCSILTTSCNDVQNSSVQGLMIFLFSRFALAPKRIKC